MYFPYQLFYPSSKNVHSDLPLNELTVCPVSAHFAIIKAPPLYCAVLRARFWLTSACDASYKLYFFLYKIIHSVPIFLPLDESQNLRNAAILH